MHLSYHGWAEAGHNHLLANLQGENHPSPSLVCTDVCYIFSPAADRLACALSSLPALPDMATTSLTQSFDACMPLPLLQAAIVTNIMTSTVVGGYIRRLLLPGEHFQVRARTAANELHNDAARARCSAAYRQQLPDSLTQTLLYPLFVLTLAPLNLLDLPSPAHS